jgi:hypothetical protein
MHALELSGKNSGSPEVADGADAALDPAAGDVQDGELASVADDSPLELASPPAASFALTAESPSAGPTAVPSAEPAGNARLPVSSSGDIAADNHPVLSPEVPSQRPSPPQQPPLAAVLRRAETRTVFWLNELVPDATARNAVAVPLARWHRSSLLSWAPLLLLRRSAAYQLLGFLAYLGCFGVMVWAVWRDYESAALSAAVLAVVVLILLVELTRLDVTLFTAVVSTRRNRVMRWLTTRALS